MSTATIQRKKVARRQKIKRAIRGRITGTQERPRLSVFRSNKEIYAQLIDDVNQRTIVSASSVEAGLKEGVTTKVEIASEVGKRLAAKAKEAQVAQVVFDRNGYLYHGRVKALADSAREGGLIF
ncbi:MAG: 50S ribosomal protein L18 [Bacteroidetes bacterium]|jgi:large subunit ribosomal protein L18|nr:50S ribosomal protein L18 [Bacteroidota bacterium]